MDNETKKLLEDYNAEFIKFRRNVEDALENIDLDNLTPRVRSFITGSGTAEAGFETGSVSGGVYARMFAEFKNEREKAFAEFKAEVASTYATLEMLTEYETATTKSIADIKSAADENKASISGIVEWQNTTTGTISDLETDVDNAKESIAGITQVANASGAFISLFAGTGTLKKDSSGNYAETENGEYIVIDKDGNELPISESDFAGVFVKKTADDSEILLRAERIKFGDNASVDNDGNLMIKRLLSSGDTANYYAKIYSSYGDFGVYESGAPKNATPVNETCLWGLYNTISDGLSFYTKGMEYLLLKESGGTVTAKPKGTWDFSSATVSGLGVVPVFG